MPPRNQSLRRPAAAALACALALTAASAGCYRRVVGARGLGTGGTTVQEPTQPSVIDRLLGPEPQPVDSRRRMRVN
jgi:hypothetical protein